MSSQGAIDKHDAECKAMHEGREKNMQPGRRMKHASKVEERKDESNLQQTRCKKASKNINRVLSKLGEHVPIEQRK